MNHFQGDIHSGQVERGVCSDSQRAEESQRGGVHGPGRRRQGEGGHLSRRHGRHVRYRLPRGRKVSVKTWIQQVGQQECRFDEIKAVRCPNPRDRLSSID